MIRTPSLRQSLSQRNSHHDSPPGPSAGSIVRSPHGIRQGERQHLQVWSRVIMKRKRLSKKGDWGGATFLHVWLPTCAGLAWHYFNNTRHVAQRIFISDRKVRSSRYSKSRRNLLGITTVRYTSSQLGPCKIASSWR